MQLFLLAFLFLSFSLGVVCFSITNNISACLNYNITQPFLFALFPSCGIIACGTTFALTAGLLTAGAGVAKTGDIAGTDDALLAAAPPPRGLSGFCDDGAAEKLRRPGNSSLVRKINSSSHAHA